MAEQTIKQMVANAEHYKAIGATEQYVMSHAGDLPTDFPWSYVVKIEDGALHRLNVAVSLYLTAQHPCGLTFRGSVDLETRDANGRGGFLLDVDRIRTMVARLPMPMQHKLTDKLSEIAAALDAKATEAFAFGRDQAGQAAAIRQMVEAEQTHSAIARLRK